MFGFCFFKQEPAYELRISDWSSEVCSSDLPKMRDGFEPLLPGFQVVKFNDLEAALAAVDDETAGFLLEPIQGEGGILPATQTFLEGLRAVCDEKDMLLIFDEVQCGVMRDRKSTRLNSSH